MIYNVFLLFLSCSYLFTVKKSCRMFALVMGKESR